MTPTDTFLSLDLLRLRLRDWNGPENAQTILLLHGLASNARIWDLLAPLLAQEFRVAAIDQRGHGLSDKPTDGYDFTTVARDLANAIAALGWKRPLVIGHSWGANVALQLAADAPDLPGGIVLLDGGTNELASTMSLEQTLERLEPPRLAGMQRATFVEMLRSRWAGSAWSQALEDAIMGNFADIDAERIAPNLTYENHMTIVRALWDQRPTQLFARVTCPVLIVPAEPPPSDERGQQWLELKRRSVEIAAATMPRAHVVWAHDSVHDIQLHHPRWLAEQLATFARSLATH